jgi:hypothetical protein
MVFIDGFGIGKEDYRFNPFFKYGFKTFTEIFGGIPTLENPKMKNSGSFLFPVDATLGIKGLPQSGTGQTSVLCGINAAQFIGKHHGPYPYSTLIPVIKEKNIFKELMSAGKKVFFANAYPQVFFDYINSGKTRLSVTSLSCRLSGMRLNRVTDLRKGRALTAEITNARWNEKLGYKLAVIKPQTAAKRLLKIACSYSFTLFEYFLTDHIGHGRFDGDIEKTLNIFDKFLLALVKGVEGTHLTLLTCSDHGNIEDLSVKTHTTNPALSIAAGKYAGYLAKSIKNLTQIKSAVLKVCG